MVSAATYLTAYIKVMPQRVKELRNLFDRKNLLDKQLRSSFQKGTPISMEVVEELLEIIGKDSIFRSAEGKNQKTLRHIMFKFIKSFEKMRKIKLSSLSWSAHPDMSVRQQKRLLRSLKTGQGILEDSLLGAIRLDTHYTQQYHALKLGDYHHYIENLTEEKLIRYNLKNLDARLKNLALNFRNFIREYFFRSKNGITGIRAREIHSLESIFMSTAAFLVGGVYFYMGTLIPETSSGVDALGILSFLLTAESLRSMALFEAGLISRSYFGLSKLLNE